MRAFFYNKRQRKRNAFGSAIWKTRKHLTDVPQYEEHWACTGESMFDDRYNSITES